MLSVLLPSRSRPIACKEAVKTARETAEGEIEILIYVDEDDPQKDSYQDHIVGPPLHSGQAMKYLAGIAKGDLLFFGCDDFQWVTKGWDRIFKEKMPEHELSVLFPHDHTTFAKAMSPVFSRRFADVTGLYPDVFKHFGPDTWIIDVGRRAGTLLKVPEVVILHKKIKDETYNRARQGNDGQNAQSQLTSLTQKRQDAADKIKCLIKTS